jgi:hypothetical protein
MPRWSVSMILEEGQHLGGVTASGKGADRNE